MSGPKIGFNPQDKFMFALNRTLVVVTDDGHVYGADVVERRLQPVFEFGGDLTGFKLRFLAALGNTIVFITEGGDVWGAEVVGRNIVSVTEFPGSKFGFNPQDRFVMLVGNLLVVVTEAGQVFGAQLAGGHVEEVFQFTGDVIPQRRFMMAVGQTLVGVTDAGDVFGADITNFAGVRPDRPGTVIVERKLRVSQFGGAKIGFNRQDRFMLALGDTLVVVTDAGDVYGADITNVLGVRPDHPGTVVVGRNLGDVYQMNPPLPFTLDLRANPNHLQINPELVIYGGGFTPGAPFHYTIHNWPKVQDIHNQGSVEVNGSFSRTESRDFAHVNADVDLPDIEVTAVDESTSRSIRATTSAWPFVAR